MSGHETTQLVDRAFHGTLAEFRVSYVARDQETALSFRFDGATCFLGVRLLDREIDDGDVRPFARVQHRDRATNTGVTAGDERHAVIQFS